MMMITITTTIELFDNSEDINDKDDKDKDDDYHRKGCLIGLITIKRKWNYKSTNGEDEI